MKHGRILGALAATGAVALLACGGTSQSLANAGGDGGGGTGSGGSSGSSSGSSSGGGSSGGGGSSSGSAGDSGVSVPGNPFVCGSGANATVCNPPEVCCGAAGGGGTTPKCEAQSACTTGLATSCSASSCPSGASCCATITLSPTGTTGSTACVVGGCGSALQLCSTTAPCPPADRCVALNGGGGGGGGIDVCRPAFGPIPDGGGAIRDAAKD